MNLENFNAHFPNRLVVAPKRNAKNWRLEKDFLYITTENLGSKTILVEVGFVTDFASVPIPFRFFVPKWGKYGRAAVIHDWLYYKGDSFEQDSEDKNKSPKEFADKVLLEAMKMSEVNYLVRGIIYKAVDWFGIFAWLSNEVKRELGMKKMEDENEHEMEEAKWSRSIGEQVPDMCKNMWGKRKNQKCGKHRN